MSSEELVKKFKEIRSDKKKQSQIMDYIQNEMFKSNVEALKLKDQLFESPELVDQNILYNMLKFLGEEVDFKPNMQKQKTFNISNINEIILQLMELNKDINNEKIDRMIIELIELKRKDG